MGRPLGSWVWQGASYSHRLPYWKAPGPRPEYVDGRRDGAFPRHPVIPATKSKHEVTQTVGRDAGSDETAGTRGPPRAGMRVGGAGRTAPRGQAGLRLVTPLRPPGAGSGLCGEVAEGAPQMEKAPALGHAATGLVLLRGPWPWTLAAVTHGEEATARDTRPPQDQVSSRRRLGDDPGGPEGRR